MIKLISEQKKLGTYLLKRYNLQWDKYLERFEGTKPLLLRATAIYPRKLEPEQIESEVELIGMISSPLLLKKFEKQYRFVAGFKDKVTRDEVESLSYIYANFLGIDVLLHQRVIDIMMKICPDDFEPIPVTLVSLNKHVQYFETKSFYAINVLKCVNAFDPNKHSSDLKDIIDSMSIVNKYFKDDPWRDGFKLFRKPISGFDYETYNFEKPCSIAVEVPGFRVIWHPELAKELPVSSLAGFFFDTEVGY